MPVQDHHHLASGSKSPHHIIGELPQCGCLVGVVTPLVFSSPLRFLSFVIGYACSPMCVSFRLVLLFVSPTPRLFRFFSHSVAVGALNGCHMHTTKTAEKLLFSPEAPRLSLSDFLSACSFRFRFCPPVSQVQLRPQPRAPRSRLKRCRGCVPAFGRRRQDG